MKKFLALLLAGVLVISMVACVNDVVDPNNPDDPDTPDVSGDEQEVKIEDVYETIVNLDKYEYGKDYTALYEAVGKNITIDQVTEDPETGLAYIEVEGQKYELGLDFLSMAMVYNCQVPEGSDMTADDVYADWYRLFIQKWNAILPEIPLYSNEYYDLYNAKITGVQEFPTNPYWSVSSALIDWASEKDDKSIIIGSTTDLSGKFRFSNFGSSSPGSADLDIETLVYGLGTVVTGSDGLYQWNNTAVKSHTEADNDDGSKTFTIEIYDDLKLSDGTPITAKNYLYTTLVYSTPVAAQAAGMDHMSGMQIVGYDAFAAFDGANEGVTVGEGDDAVVATKALAGLRLINDYTFSVTIDAEYLPYYYDIAYAGFSPVAQALWLNDCDIADDGNGAYITGNFYAKEGDSYTYAAHVTASALNTDQTYPYSGPYMVESYDTATKEAVLVKNPNFKGDYKGTVPAIEKVIYKKIVSSTQLDDLLAGNLDFIAGITGGDETNEAVSAADNSNGAYAYIHYSRAGYGKLGFRADFGPTQFTEVRLAIAYCMDRATFAKEFTGGYGGVVDGPYYSNSWMHQAALADGMQLQAYPTSADAAIDMLVAGGWIWDAEGKPYVEGVRYKAIHKDDIKAQDITFQSKDGAYKVNLVGDYYYMPLVINWYGTTDNPFTDQLVTGFMENANIAAAGIEVQNQIGEFAPMLDELYQMAVYGYYAGTPMYNAFNFATGFTSAAYAWNYNCTIDPAMYDNYSQWYVKDAADVMWLND
ncbi:MAG: hypothetical protein IJP09_02400 [Clostridia bacterium]|nr:hypothetical protein [Clostridia bacterium]